ncbi:MAG: lysophospholipase [Owenweeksia sp.]|nr:lysophospholipase [Owenweeksia sp.]MBF98563.1 lysophospholipase [Owenweeksia sp.]|tara:strand:+ start:1826 stop:2533 length:708 start_codon:yes stop_codon:yes gene_type:complete
MIRTSLLAIYLALIACTPQEKEIDRDDVTGMADALSYSYLALGDSYTIGTAIGTENSYATLLADSLTHHDSILHIKLDIIAQNGWTTTNLLNALNKENIAGNYNLVSLLIGVNNQFQGRSKTEYRKEFTALLQKAMAYAGGDAGRVMVLSIPDYGVTPYGASNRESIAGGIDEFNAINKEVSDTMNVLYVDITPLSRAAANDPQLVASDKLHFSSEMHKLWMKRMYEPALSTLLP